jgi:hypothetical protein
MKPSRGCRIRRAWSFRRDFFCARGFRCGPCSTCAKRAPQSVGLAHRYNLPLRSDDIKFADPYRVTSAALWPVGDAGHAKGQPADERPADGVARSRRRAPGLIFGPARWASLRRWCTVQLEKVFGRMAKMSGKGNCHDNSVSDRCLKVSEFKLIMCNDSQHRERQQSTLC